MKRLIGLVLLLMLSISVGFYMGYETDNDLRVDAFAEEGRGTSGESSSYLSGEPDALKGSEESHHLGVDEVDTIPSEQVSDELLHFDMDAIDSMQYAREEGDPRAPGLTSPGERVMPTEQELEDYDAYEEYEQREARKTYRAYVLAAEKKVQYLKDMIGKAEAEGLPEEQIKEGKEKLRLIELMRAELLQQHPDLLDAHEASSN